MAAAKVYEQVMNQAHVARHSLRIDARPLGRANRTWKTRNFKTALTQGAVMRYDT